MLQEVKLLTPNDQSSAGPSPDIVSFWRDAEPHIFEYPAGSITGTDGQSGYRYPAGRRLVINDELVMDTCEAPWAFDTVRTAFRQLYKYEYYPMPAKKVKVLERGAGLNIMGTAIMHQLLNRRAGEYHVIELNKGVAEETRKWMDEWRYNLDNDGIEYGVNMDIQLYLHEGEAREVTRKLIIDEKKRFDFIFSDTYPLDESETGVNDLSDLDIIKIGLRRRPLTRIRYGIFGFFPYHPGSSDVTEDGYVTTQQSALLTPHFPQRMADLSPVKPARGYDYLFGPDGQPIRNLPMVLCAEKDLF